MDVKAKQDLAQESVKALMAKETTAEARFRASLKGIAGNLQRELAETKSHIDHFEANIENIVQGAIHGVK